MTNPASSLGSNVVAFNPNFKLPMIHLPKLQGEPVKDREWIVDDLIPAKSVTMISGDGGLGKSLLAMQLMTCCAIDRPWLGRTTAHIRSIGVFCEDDEDELHFRQERINRHYECQFDSLGDVHWLPRVGEDNTLVEYVTRFEDGVRKEDYEVSYLLPYIENACHANAAQLVILDSLHDLYGGSENDRRQARRFIQCLRELAIAIKGAVVLLAHPSLSGMAAGTGSSGTTAWNNAVRSRLYLTKPKLEEGDQEDHDARVLKTMKANYGSVGGEIRLRYQDGVFINEDAIARPGAAFSGMESRTKESQLLDAIDRLNARKQPVSARPRAGNYAPKVLCRLPEYRGQSWRTIESTLRDLLANNVIVEAEIGRDEHRNRLVSLTRKRETEGGGNVDSGTI